MFKNKVLMITGGTGSFGKAVLNRFIDTDFEEIRIFSRDEKKQEDLRISLNNSKVKFFHLGPENKWKNNINDDIIKQIEKNFHTEMKELNYL